MKLLETSIFAHRTNDLSNERWISLLSLLSLLLFYLFSHFPLSLSRPPPPTPPHPTPRQAHIEITLGRNTDILKITFVSVLISLLFSLFAISISDFHLRRWYGYSLIAIYLAYFSWTMVYVLADAGLINIAPPRLPSWM